MEKRLGRGLGSLLGQEAVQAPPTAEQVTENPTLPVKSIRPNPFQPRKIFDPEALAELTASIRNHGCLQPIVVRKADDHYQLISGERRWRASQAAGKTSIPVVIRDVPDDQMLELALVENLQRKDLDPIERAIGFKDMQDSLSLTQEQVAQKVGLKRTTVTNHLRLLELPEKVRKAVQETLISMGHARALLGLDKEKEMIKLLETTIRDDLSVRQLETFVRAKKVKLRESGPESPNSPAESRAPWIVDAERRLRETLGTRCTLENLAGYQGRIMIQYFGKDELERLLEKLAPKPTL